MARPKVGDLLHSGRYRIIIELGEGGMGVVFLAENKAGKLVAIKVSAREDARSLRIFQEEAMLHSRLRHPAIPAATFVSAPGEMDMLVMDYIEGEDLIDFLRRDVSLDLKVYVADQLAGAVEYLHRRRPKPVIHRDIKPQNVRITSQGQIFLVDFGIGKDGTATMTDAHGAYTPAYAPVEQIRGSGTSERSDIYSLGATLYQLFSGEKAPPALSREMLTAEEDFDQMSAPFKGAWNSLRYLQGPLLKAMARDAADRYESVSEFRREVCLERGFYRIGSALLAGEDPWKQSSGTLKAENLHQRSAPTLIFYWKPAEHANPALAEASLALLEEQVEKNDPYLPYIYDTYERGPYRCALIDEVPGVPLDDLLRRQLEPAPRPQVRAWTEQLMAMLDRLHGLPLPMVCWNLTPSNLIVTPEQRLRLRTYDLTPADNRWDDRYADRRWANRYAAPEEFDDAVGQTPQSDLYRAGAILYQLLTGEEPSSAMDRQRAADSGEPDPLRLDQVSDKVRGLLKTTLALDPAARCADVAAMRAAFGKVPMEFWLEGATPWVQPPPDPEAPGVRDMAALAYSLLAGRSSAFYEGLRAGEPGREPPPSLASAFPELPPLLDDLLGRLLAPASAERTPDLETLADELGPLFRLREAQRLAGAAPALVIYAGRRSQAQEERLRAGIALESFVASSDFSARAQRALRVVRDLAGLLDQLCGRITHEEPFWHVAPATIWLGQDGGPWLLCDVGAATCDERFLAPEQRLGDRRRSSDAFALAALAYYLLTRQPPPDPLPADHLALKGVLAAGLDAALRSEGRPRGGLGRKVAVAMTADALATGMAVEVADRELYITQAGDIATMLARALKQDGLIG